MLPLRDTHGTEEVGEVRETKEEQVKRERASLAKEADGRKACILWPI